MEYIIAICVAVVVVTIIVVGIVAYIWGGRHRNGHDK